LPGDEWPQSTSASVKMEWVIQRGSKGEGIKNLDVLEDEEKKTGDFRDNTARPAKSVRVAKCVGTTFNPKKEKELKGPQVWGGWTTV